MTELEKIKQVFESIIDLCNEMTTGNISHHRSTIKSQSEYGIEQLENIGKINVNISIDKLIDQLEIKRKNINEEELTKMLVKVLDSAVYNETDSTICSSRNKNPIVAFFRRMRKFLKQ
jgi:hypothetical protein